MKSLLPRELQRIYDRRFSQSATYRNHVWEVLTGAFFARWIAPDATVLDLGCGYGEFINNIRATRKFAMDLNPSCRSRLAKEIHFLEQDCSLKWEMPDGSLDVVFTSNFLEHLPSKAAVQCALRESFRCLRPAGLFIAMGPNIKCLHGRYWDFIDHHVPLTEASLGEALEVEGFRLLKVTARFLPFTLANSPQYPLSWLKIYLSLPITWQIFGRQFLIIASKNGVPHSV